MVTEPLESIIPLSDEEIIDVAYEIFTALAADNLEPADIILFNLQSEENGAAELYDLDTPFWAEYLYDMSNLANHQFAEVVIGLANNNGIIDNIYARFLLCRDKTVKTCHIIWKTSNPSQS